MFDILPIDRGVAAPKGFFCDGVHAGLKSEEGLDVGFIYSDTLCECEALFTKNRFQAAPLKHFQKYSHDFKSNFLLVNSKNANAMTAQEGINDIDEILEELKKINKDITFPIMSSTGVIGVRLPKDKIINSFSKLDLSKKDSDAFSKSIMTTDSYKKELAYKIILESGESFTIGASAKGAGMINPSMATMLCFITTDANVPRNDMKDLLNIANESSFNAISVDGDRSTNDTVLLLSNSKSNAYDKDAFLEALKLVTHRLALMIVSDGEGAKKSVAFRVENANSEDDAKKAARALSNSLLVKTALFGEDPNWGRIASTIGASEVECKEDKLRISFEDVTVYDRGIVKFDSENEARAAKVLQKDSFYITCDLGLGDFSYTAYGCDLGYEYVRINADYRT
jgi:glutamate N-acetyltransferase/amino-acid N-acetyltransferase